MQRGGSDGRGGMQAVHGQLLAWLPISNSVNSYTITAYSELYCGEKTVERNLIQAMLGVGACLGVLFINFVSDYKGRKFSFIVSLATGIFSIIRIPDYK
jgi:MFS family permease